MEIDFIWIQGLNLESIILSHNIVENVEDESDRFLLEDMISIYYIFIYLTYIQW